LLRSFSATLWLGRLHSGFVSRVAEKIFCVRKRLVWEAYVACGLAVNARPEFILAACE
jgi:hypothetical protein